MKSAAGVQVLQQLKLRHQLSAFGRELPVEANELAQQNRSEDDRQSAQNGEMLHCQLPRLRRIMGKMSGLECSGERRSGHGQTTSAKGRPCAKGASHPSSLASVGTRSIDSTGRSTVTFSRIRGPSAISHVVLERASPVRWCWKPLPPGSASPSRPKSGRMNMLVLPLYSGLLWMVFHSSAQMRSERTMASVYSENAPEWAMSTSCSVIQTRFGAIFCMTCCAI